MDCPTDQWTEKPSYRDANMHLEIFVIRTIKIEYIYLFGVSQTKLTTVDLDVIVCTASTDRKNAQISFVWGSFDIYIPWGTHFCNQMFSVVIRLEAIAV